MKDHEFYAGIKRKCTNQAIRKKGKKRHKKAVPPAIEAAGE